MTETVALEPMPVSEGLGTARATHPICGVPPLMVIVQSFPDGTTSPQISQIGQFTRYSIDPLPRVLFFRHYRGIVARFFDQIKSIDNSNKERLNLMKKEMRPLSPLRLIKVYHRQ